MEIRLSICKDEGPEKSIAMHCNPYRIGRSDECDLQLHSRSVSRMHCELKIKRVGLTVKDLGSRNGTIVNGVAAAPGVRVLLRLNDKIAIGKYRITVCHMAGSAAEPSADLIDEGLAVDPDSDHGSNDLLEMLEQFISEHRHSLPVTTDDSPTGKSHASDKSEEHWTQLRQSAVESDNDSLNNTDDESRDDLPNSETTVTVDTLNDPNAEEAQATEAEARRLELRNKIESLRAKDSREAADRALKNLFRR